MKQCDIVAAEFLYGYASTEIEGMSLEKPVLANLENSHYKLIIELDFFLIYFAEFYDVTLSVFS